MLVIRLHRAGRRNSSFFRVVLTEKSKPAKSGFKKVLGWYNPHTKEASFKKDEILAYVKNGAVVSNSLAKILALNGIKDEKIKFVAKTPKKPKGKDEEKSEVAPKIAEKAEKSEDEAEKPAEQANEEVAHTEGQPEETDEPQPNKEPEENK